MSILQSSINVYMKYGTCIFSHTQIHIISCVFDDDEKGKTPFEKFECTYMVIICIIFIFSIKCYFFLKRIRKKSSNYLL